MGENLPSYEDQQEQTPEEILKILEKAIEIEKGVLLTQVLENGESITNPALPIVISENFLTIESDGFVFDIKIDTIKKVELPQ